MHKNQYAQFALKKGSGNTCLLFLICCVHISKINRKSERSENSVTHFLGRLWTGGGCTGWVGAGRFRLGSRAGLGIPGRMGGVPPYGGPGGPMGAP